MNPEQLARLDAQGASNAGWSDDQPTHWMPRAIFALSCLGWGLIATGVWLLFY